MREQEGKEGEKGGGGRKNSLHQATTTTQKSRSCCGSLCDLVATMRRVLQSPSLHALNSHFKTCPILQMRYPTSLMMRFTVALKDCADANAGKEFCNSSLGVPMCFTNRLQCLDVFDSVPQRDCAFLVPFYATACRRTSQRNVAHRSRNSWPYKGSIPPKGTLAGPCQGIAADGHGGRFICASIPW